MFLALVLWHYDLELEHSNAPVTTDCTRAGLGILPPTQDVLLRYRLRARAGTSCPHTEGQRGERDSDGTVEMTE